MNKITIKNQPPFPLLNLIHNLIHNLKFKPVSQSIPNFPKYQTFTECVSTE